MYTLRINDNKIGIIRNIRGYETEESYKRYLTKYINNKINMESEDEVDSYVNSIYKEVNNLKKNNSFIEKIKDKTYNIYKNVIYIYMVSKEKTQNILAKMYRITESSKNKIKTKILKISNKDNLSDKSKNMITTAKNKIKKIKENVINIPKKVVNYGCRSVKYILNLPAKTIKYVKKKYSKLRKSTNNYKEEPRMTITLVENKEEKTEDKTEKVKDAEIIDDKEFLEAKNKIDINDYILEQYNIIANNESYENEETSAKVKKI